MPYMISDKPLHIAHNGMDARFEAGVSRFVRPSLQPMAEQCGAKVVDDPQPASAGSSEAEQGVSDEQLRRIIEQLMEAGDTSAFGSDDKPRTRALSDEAGTKIGAAQRNRVWEQMLNDG